MLCTFGEHGLEAHVRDGHADVVGIDELGVAEDLGFHAQIFFEGGFLLLDLIAEFHHVLESRKAVVVGFAEYLHATGVHEGLEAVDNLGSVTVELLQHSAGDGECHLEFALVLLDCLEQELIHGQIALLRHPAEYGAVRKVVVIMGVLADVEESEQTKPRGLMDLEIQTDVRFHRVIY